MQDIERIVQDALNKLLRNELQPARANAVSRLCSTFLKCREISKLEDIELRLQALEKKAGK